MPRKVPRVSLHALRPPLDVPDVATFEYPQLESVVERDFKDKYETVDEVFERYDADDEEALDIRLSHEYLLLAALKLQKADTDRERELWSRRYTDVSIEIFGRPWIDEAASIAAKELEELKLQANSSPVDKGDIELVLSTYQKIAAASPNDDTASDYSDLLIDLRHLLESRHKNVYAVLNDAPKGSLSAKDVRRVFEASLYELGWDEWRVVENETAQMSVSPQRKTINIGSYIPTLSHGRVRALLTHEVLTHAQRAVRGGQYDTNLAYGLPGYITAEEGLAVLLETAIVGHLPNRVGDRYVDITLALGTAVTSPMSRFELFKLTVNRTLLRLGADANKANRSTVRRLAWQHVNRIYRGSLGNEFVGVLTKDAAYYRGYQDMAEYLSRYQGERLEKALDFVLSGKFDPIKPHHRLYVHGRRFNAEYPLKEL